MKERRSARAPAADADPGSGFGPWAQRIHEACRALPHFQRLADDCRGDAAAAAIAVETLMDEIDPPETNDLPPGTAPGSANDPRRRPLQAACAAAAKELQAYRDAAEGLAGVAFAPAPRSGGASDRRTDLARVKPLVSRLRESPKLQRIATLAGRFKRIAAAKRRQRVRHGADEIADVEEGADIGRILPAELVRLHHPLLRKVFLRGLLERQLLQYQLVGNDTLTSGPLVVLLDKSTSMDHDDRDVWAAAVAIALLDHAAAQRRPFALVTFTGRIVGETLVQPGGALPWDALTVASEGATDISRAVSRALDLIARGPPPFREADVVLITDGGSDSSDAPALRERARGSRPPSWGSRSACRPRSSSPGATTSAARPPSRRSTRRSRAPSSQLDPPLVAEERLRSPSPAHCGRSESARPGAATRARSQTASLARSPPDCGPARLGSPSVRSGRHRARSALG